ncbi:amidohydrolase [Paraferrimonas sedimenticola]|uniref:Amidohydrolase n=1 Tax=Paraferrimonas sedimenticola TaxID=375674 RepID=A0AA37RWB6_9GAMM|nr:amidohydrolase [Paraferrimonas sedimenticola]GLP96179.1 amidohydrolase [Paraferrimonas sedimenticola]
MATRIYQSLAAAALLCSVPYHVLAESSLLHNVKGYTVNQGKLVEFAALKFEEDRVSQVFLQAPKLSSDIADQIIDGKGKTLLPGLIDAHGHVLGYGQGLLRVDLRNSSSEADAVAMVTQFAKESGVEGWVLGRGWNQEVWSERAFPSAKALDAVFPDQAVYLTRVDGHAGWANSKAMELAGITANTQSPSGGEIIRDAEGNPTGVFVDNAMDLITHAIARPSVKEQQTLLLNALNELASMGLTSVHDAGVSLDTIQAYKNLDVAGLLPIRVNVMVDVLDPEWLSQLEQGVYHSPSNKLSINSVKISADGALGSRGAALIKAYSDRPGQFGLLLHEPKQLHQLIETSMKAGYQVNTHAIGDKANLLVLDDYIELIKKTGTVDLRHRVEHAQILQPQDLNRFAKNGIIASMQATHATSDKNMAEDRLGSERIKGAYAWKTLLSNGTIIANGSDFPVESPNPFYGLHAAITRQDHDNQPKGGWYANEAMDFTQALKSFTYDAAYAGHQEKLIGSLEAGKKADFILIDRDIKQVDPSQIWQTQVKQVWVDGKLIYTK